MTLIEASLSQWDGQENLLNSIWIDILLRNYSCKQSSTDWMEQSLNMNYWITYLVKVYNIPPYLVIYLNQTGIHLVPSVGGRTWDVKIVKDVKILGLQVKRQISCVVSSNAWRKFLHPQLIFIDKTNWCLPKYIEPKVRYREEGWHLTFSTNHWSTLETSKQFVEKVLHPYLASMINLHNLPKYQKLVWLIDSWSLHKNYEFLDWIKSEHANVLVPFVLANCTSKL